LGEMKRCINRYVKETLFEGKQLPPNSSRRFFPLSRDITNHMLNEENQLKHSKIDQENLHILIEKWKIAKPNDLFYFRGYTEGKGKHQTNERLWFNEHGLRIVCHFYTALDYWLVKILFIPIYFKGTIHSRV